MSENTALKSLMLSLDKEFGKGYTKTFEMLYEKPQNFISTGSVSLDRAIGGGIPKGRITEIYGWESSGKSTIASSTMANATNGGLWIDAEKAFDPVWASTLGMDASKHLVIEPGSFEQTRNSLYAAAATPGLDLIVLDSLTSNALEDELQDKDEAKHKIGLFAKKAGTMFKILATELHKNDIALIVINQLRHNPGQVYGNPEVTGGGNALKFYASVRLRVAAQKSMKILENGEEVGYQMKIKVDKNKITFRTTDDIMIPFNIYSGIDSIGDLVNVGVDSGIFTKAGSWYSFGDTRIGQGVSSVKQFLLDNPELFEETKNKILNG
jgi:recombination protein RecA